jgi:hypothetical protein
MVTADAGTGFEVYVTEPGFVNEPLLVTVIVLAPVLLGVYVNVPVGVPELMLTVVGVKVPPAPPSLGVTTTVPVIAPFAPTVKLVEATPVTPLVGPESVTAVAPAAVDVYVMFVGLDNPPLLVTLMVLAPVELGV